ncbi:hypothetical protein [Sphingomonas agri]
MSDGYHFADEESVAAASASATKQQCDRFKAIAGEEMSVKITVLSFGHGH